jgi:hypothetical protein
MSDGGSAVPLMRWWVGNEAAILIAIQNTSGIGWNQEKPVLVLGTAGSAVHLKVSHGNNSTGHFFLQFSSNSKFDSHFFFGGVDPSCLNGGVWVGLLVFDAIFAEGSLKRKETFILQISAKDPSQTYGSIAFN